MFKVSKALKITAWIACAVFVVLAIYLGVFYSILWYGSGEEGVPILAGGFFLGWLSFITLYGFGVLVEKAELDLAANKGDSINK